VQMDHFSYDLTFVYSALRHLLSLSMWKVLRNRTKGEYNYRCLL
jgi:hypothetical protein